jgi:hydrogenase maturation protein HypF
MSQAIIIEQRLKITVKGVVQGVGFRPFIYQLADKHNLKGWVLNTSGSVEIEAEGDKNELDEFLIELRQEHPPQAHISNLSFTDHRPAGYKTFEIRKSLSRPEEYQLISPDLATCCECQYDFTNKQNHRYGYPFTNCTNCGPRFTIIKDIPYDRPLTTMNVFKMCPTCQAEYDDPLNRRFHAQPNACPICGPTLWLTDAQGKKIDTQDVIGEVARLLKDDAIMAIRGLGGYLLAANAEDGVTIKRLRERKRRPAKPFAVMLSTMNRVREHCYLSVAEEKLLAAPSNPIVLLRWKDSSSISRAVAPSLNYVGVMLPYTPLHHLLMQQVDRPLIMTSGNLSEEPIAKDNDEALVRLQGIADYLLQHNREIHSRYDDSVAMVVDEQPVILRRARGYAPYPVRLPFKARQILACGAEEKNTFCLTRDENAFVSQHIGDMENEETLEHFEKTVALYSKMFRIKPQLLAADMHPDYLATKWAQARAEKRKLPLVYIQHHHAHIVSCMAENGVKEPVIGVAFDGTGYGPDGHIWGGEFMIADCKNFERCGHLEYLPLPGGSAAIKRPYRTAIGYLYTLLGEEILTKKLPCLDSVDKTELELIRKQVDKQLNSPLTSSCGRLFDAVAALAGVCTMISYEAQAAIELEMAAGDIWIEETYPFSITEDDSVKIIHLKEMLEAIVVDIRKEAEVATISAKFHNTVAQMIVKMCSELTRESGIRSIVLSGGCFQNRRLLKKVTAELLKCNLKVLNHHQVPANDGGISLGQAVIANHISGGN